MHQSGYLHSFFFLIVLAENMVQDGRDGAKAGHSRLAPDHGGKHPSSDINIQSAVIFYRWPPLNEEVSYPDVV